MTHIILIKKRAYIHAQRSYYKPAELILVLSASGPLNDHTNVFFRASGLIFCPSHVSCMRALKALTYADSPGPSLLDKVISFQSKEEGKHQELIQLSTIPDPRHRMGKRKTHTKRHIQGSQEFSHFPTGDHKAARNRHGSVAKTNPNNKKRSTKEAPPWNDQ